MLFRETSRCLGAYSQLEVNKLKQKHIYIYSDLKIAKRIWSICQHAVKGLLAFVFIILIRVSLPNCVLTAPVCFLLIPYIQSKNIILMHSYCRDNPWTLIILAAFQIVSNTVDQQWQLRDPFKPLSTSVDEEEMVFGVTKKEDSHTILDSEPNEVALQPSSVKSVWQL